MKNISIYVKNKNLKPSNFYRIIQYLPYLDNCNIKVHSVIPDFLYSTSIKYRDNFIIRKFLMLITLVYSGLYLFFSLIYDYFYKPNSIIVQKSLSKKINFPSFIFKFMEYLFNSSNLIWDFDDNILYDDEITKKEFDLYCTCSNTIIVSNVFLKKLLPDYCLNKTIILPTTDCKYNLHENFDELKSIINTRKLIFKSEINLIWIATSSNLKHLEQVVSILDETALDVENLYQKKLILKVVCDKPLLFDANNLLIQNIKWSRETAFIELQKSYIGIMPLIHNEYTKGKAGFKIVQYLATGLPVIASNVGFNKTNFSSKVGFFIDDFIDVSEWKTSILSLIESNTLWHSFSFEAFSFWENNFNYTTNINVLRDILDL